MNTKKKEKLWEKFWNCPDSFEIVQTFLKLSGQFWNYPDSFGAVRTVLKLYGQFWNRPDSFEIVRTVLKSSGQFWNRPDSLKNCQDSFKLSGQNCSFYNIRAKIFRTRKNFPGSNATALPGFLGLCDVLVQWSRSLLIQIVFLSNPPASKVYCSINGLENSSSPENSCWMEEDFFLSQYLTDISEEDFTEDLLWYEVLLWNPPVI